MAFSKRISTQSLYRAGGFISEEHIKEHCKNGTMQLWLAVTDTNEILCVGVTEIREYPNYKVCDAKSLLVKGTKNGLTKLIKWLNGLKNKVVKKWNLFKTRLCPFI